MKKERKIDSIAKVYILIERWDVCKLKKQEDFVSYFKKIKVLERSVLLYLCDIKELATL